MKKRHDDDREEQRELRNNLNRLQTNWSQFWDENMEVLLQKPNYGIIKLRYDIAQRKLGAAVSMVEDVDNVEPDSTDVTAGNRKVADIPPTPNLMLEVTSTEAPHWCEFPKTPGPPICIQCGDEAPDLYDEDGSLTKTDD